MSWDGTSLGAWVAYTPVLTAATTNPTGVVGTGAYMTDGKTMHYRIHFPAGTANGSGNYAFSLPLPTSVTQNVGTLIEGGGSMIGVAACAGGSTAAFVILQAGGTTALWSGGFGGTTGKDIYISGTCERA